MRNWPKDDEHRSSPEPRAQRPTVSPPTNPDYRFIQAKLPANKHFRILKHDLWHERLSNGALVTFLSMPGCGSISSCLYLRRGVLGDPSDKIGLAHLSEHMNFRDRQSGANEHTRMTTSRCSVNGSTSNSLTIYNASGPAHEAERIVNYQIASLRAIDWPSAILAREKKIILHEMLLSRNRISPVRSLLCADRSHNVHLPVLGCPETEYVSFGFATLLADCKSV